MAKRIFDLLFSALGLLLLSPLYGAIAVLIKLDSRGPVFYRGNRVGQGGRPFRICKFRSMVSDADKQGPGITTATDSRTTRVGRILRRTKLDEFPQLINVFLGDMSFVGPRPEDPHYVAYYSEEQRQILLVRPGITSRASIEFRNEQELLSGDDWEKQYLLEVMPRKLAADLAYMKEQSLCRDILLIFATLGTVIKLVSRPS